MKLNHNDVALSHTTLTQPLLVLILWSRRRHVSLKGSQQEHALTETLASCFSSCNVLWCVLVQPFSTQAFLLLQSRRRCPVFKHDQHAPFTLSMSIRSTRVLNRYNWHSSVPCEIGTHCYSCLWKAAACFLWVLQPLHQHNEQTAGSFDFRDFRTRTDVINHIQLPFSGWTGTWEGLEIFFLSTLLESELTSFAHSLLISALAWCWL